MIVGKGNPSVGKLVNHVIARNEAISTYVNQLSKV